MHETENRPPGPVATSKREHHGVEYTLLHVPFCWHGVAAVAKIRHGQHLYPEEWCEALRDALALLGFFPNTGIDNGGRVELWDSTERLSWNVWDYWNGSEWER